MANNFEDIGMAAIKKLFGNIDFDITEYCNAAIDEAYEYCVQEFKKACKREGIQWDKSWEDILDGE